MLRDVMRTVPESQEKEAVTKKEFQKTGVSGTLKPAL